MSFNAVTKSVSSIKSRIFGDVDFTAELVKDPHEYLDAHPLVVYGQEIEGTAYNLMHAHVSALGEAISMDAQYVEEGKEDRRKLAEGLDTASGSEFKYRALVQKASVKEIIYGFMGNVLPVKFTERKLRLDEIVNVKSLGIPDVELARVVGIPLQNLVAAENDEKARAHEHSAPQHEVIAMCTEGRLLEAFPGYVDIELVPNVAEKPVQLRRVTVSACRCEQGSEEEYRKVLVRWRQTLEGRCTSLGARTKELLTRFREVMKAPDIEAKRAFLGELYACEGELIALPDSELNPGDAVSETQEIWVEHCPKHAERCDRGATEADQRYRVGPAQAIIAFHLRLIVARFASSSRCRYICKEMQAS